MLPLLISPGQGNGSGDKRRKCKSHTISPTLKVLPRSLKQLILHIELFSPKQMYNSRDPSLFLSELLQIRG